MTLPNYKPRGDLPCCANCERAYLDDEGIFTMLYCDISQEHIQGSGICDLFQLIGDTVSPETK